MRWSDFSDYPAIEDPVAIIRECQGCLTQVHVEGTSHAPAPLYEQPRWSPSPNTNRKADAWELVQEPPPCFQCQGTQFTYLIIYDGVPLERVQPRRRYLA